VAPIPVVALDFVILVLVHDIGVVPSSEIIPVSVLLVIIPVVVVAVVPIVDADLHAGFLRRGGGHDCSWCSNGSSQDDDTDVTIQIAQMCSSRSETCRLRIPVEMTVRW
jgi:hypothetical protein